MLQSEEKTLAAIKKYAGLVLANQDNVAYGIEIMREAGVSNANIKFFFEKQPGAFMTAGDRFGQVEKMGFNPSTWSFVLAVSG